MIATIQDAIVAELLTITDMGTVAAWQGEVGDLDDILQIPQKLPALHVIYNGGEYGEKKVIGANRVNLDMQFMLILVSKNLKGRKEGAAASYTIIEAVRDKLMGFQVSPYGFFWPVREDLLRALGGVQIYGLIYRINANV